MGRRGDGEMGRSGDKELRMNKLIVERLSASLLALVLVLGVAPSLKAAPSLGAAPSLNANQQKPRTTKRNAQSSHAVETMSAEEREMVERAKRLPASSAAEIRKEAFPSTTCRASRRFQCTAPKPLPAQKGPSVCCRLPKI